MKQFTSTLITLLLCLYVTAQVGSPDVSFNSPNGYSTLALSPDDDYGTSMVVQPDGKIVVVAVIKENWFKVLRYNINGSLDATFGLNGIVTARVSPGDDAQSFAVALQSNGKIIVGGYTWSADNNDFALLRLDTDGSVDGSFGTNGWVYTNTTNITASYGDDQIRQLAILPDNSIIAAGYSYNGLDRDFTLAKYDANGGLVTSFGVNGIGKFNINNDDVISGIAINSLGNIVAVGSTNVSTTTDMTIAQFTANGAVDNTFGGAGYVTIGSNSITEKYEGAGIVIQSDGKIVVSGVSPAGFSTTDIFVARVLPNGSLDASFNGTGFTNINYATSVANDEARSMVLQPDGKIIVAGATDGVSGGSYDAFLVRIKTNGTLDSTFGTNGKAVNNISAGTSDHAQAVAIYGNRIYATGIANYTNTSGTRDFFFGAFVNDYNTLPLVLSNFYAQKQTNSVTLQWQTSSEENLKHFIVQRSTDGVTYMSIGQVAAVGNSNQLRSYSFVDQSPFIPANNFYRLIMQDIDGNYKYSKIVTVKYASELNFSLQLSPNPTSNLLQIQMPDGMKGNVSLQIFDINGRVVRRNNLASDGSALSTSIDVSNLSSGVYILQAQSGTTKLVGRFVKK